MSKKITLKTLGEKTDLSVSFLSQVERGKSSLAITSLKKIAVALDIPMKDLVDYESNTKYIFKNDNKLYKKLQEHYKSYDFVSGKFEGRTLEVIILVIDKYCELNSDSHFGEEVYYVLEGKGFLCVDDVEYEISKNDTLHFPSTLKHCIRNPYDEDLKLFSVITQLIF